MTNETEKFDAMAHDDWWSPRGRLFSLHKINPVRFAYFAQKAGGVEALKSRRVLDVGCGGGVLAEEFARAGAEVTGIDLSTAAIEAATRHAKKSGLSIDYRLTSIGDFLKEEPEGFDIVVCAEVLEHVEDVEKFLTEALRPLKKGGLFFFATLNKTMKARFFAIFVAEDILGMLPRGTHDFGRFVRPSTIVETLAGEGVKVEDIRGMSYDPLRLEFRLSRDTSINYLGYARKD